jgi:predicted Ser/Thr protein kinase
VGEREQELARTATAPGSAAVEPAEPVGATLGRYRLERELGAGAMGVVHAAFDPDLERRIALKVLRGVTATVDAKDRLMREARAMARLTHPNVVTVHEVGTAGGRDFIAMELIHGESLAEWLRATQRPPAAIVEAFIAAGRGLAAAHAAGVVHRDFKPHNVLRSRDGRIVVTDFGLAREAETALPPALDATLPVGSVMSTPSSLSGLTMTGALLGTPAYMAPEQWRGGAVTPATDQFAYCVALWEALAGARPYPGPTLEDLRAQVGRGPGALDASHIPRRLRGVLRRGLDPDPAERWPNMETLLARLTRAQRRPGVALAIGAAALGAAALAVIVLRPSAPVAACEPPARDVDAVWSPAIRAEFAGKTSAEHVAALDMAYWDWRAARGAACGAPPQLRLAELQCLDGALARFDALRQGFERAPGAPAEEIRAQIVDPAVCRKTAVAEIPRLNPALATPDVINAYALYGRSYAEKKPAEAELAGAIAAPIGDACARVITALAFENASHDVPRARALMADAISAADQCGDERLRADLLIRDSRYHWELPMIGPKGEAAMRLARNAAAHVMQPDIEATLAAYSLVMARQSGRWDDAFKLADAEIAGYRASGLTRRVVVAILWRNGMRIVRSEPAGLEAVRRDVAAIRPYAVAIRAELVRQLDVQDALARYRLGDVAGSHDDLIRLWRAQPPDERPRRTRHVTGQVVDPAGHPVAGAQVAAASDLSPDSISIAVPGFLEEDSLRDTTLRIVTSDASGQFTIADAAPEGAVAAQLGERRSRPVAIADRVRLVVEPTRRVSGKVLLGGAPHTRAAVLCNPVGDPTGRMVQIAPVAADGSFVLDHTWVGALRVGASLRGAGEANQNIEFHPVAASTAATTGVTIDLAASSRTIDVIVRSAVATPIDGGQVILLAGHMAISNLGDLIRVQNIGVQTHMARPLVGESAPRAVLDKVRSGDLIAHVEHARAGDLTVCAFGLTGDLHDPDYIQTLQSHISELAVKCEFIGPTTSLVVLAVPPLQRFDEK